MGSGNQDRSVSLESRESAVKPWVMERDRWEGARSGRMCQEDCWLLKGDHHDQSYILERFLHVKDRLAPRGMFRRSEQNPSEW